MCQLKMNNTTVFQVSRAAKTIIYFREIHQATMERSLGSYFQMPHEVQHTEKSLKA